MIDFINNYGLLLIGALLVALAGTLGRFLNKVGKVHLDTPAKQEAARTAVRYVEQIFKDLHGARKLQKALDTASEILAKQHIKWDADEMTVIIEAAVEEMNEYLKPPLLAVDTADAVRITNPNE